MRVIEKLRTFNTIAFSVMSVLVILTLAAVLANFARSWNDDPRYNERNQLSERIRQYSGDVTHYGDRKIIYYHRSVPGGAQLDARFVGMVDGRVLKVSKDPGQLIYGFELLQHKEQNDGGAIGYVALVNTGKNGGKQLFDVVLGRFSDMTQMTLAKDVSAMDSPTALDDKNFSVVLWKEREGATFNIFEVASGRAVVTKELGMERRSVPDAAAPVNKYH